MTDLRCPHRCPDCGATFVGLFEIERCQDCTLDNKLAVEEKEKSRGKSKA